MKHRHNSFWFPLLTVAYGIIFGVIVNLLFDRLTSAIFPPIAVTIVFLVFLLPLLLIIFLYSKHAGTHQKLNDFNKAFWAALAVFCVAVFLLELLYEVNLTKDYSDPDSYIFIIDDSGSMTSSDPDNKRSEILNKLVEERPDGFEYAVYSFSDSVEKIRDMADTSVEFEASFDSAGGTAIHGALSKVIEDVKNSNTKTGNSTKVIMLSDGYATDLMPFGFGISGVLREYVKNDLIISTVGLGNSVDETLLKKVARATGGDYVHAKDISDLDTAMQTAAMSLNDRTLLGYRGSCSTNLLHGIMRIVFLLLIGVLLDYLKITVYGRYRKHQIIILAIALILASLLTEVLLEVFYVGEAFVRCALFALLALFLIDKLASPSSGEKRHWYLFAKRAPTKDDPDTTQPVRDSNSLKKDHNEKKSQFKSLE